MQSTVCSDKAARCLSKSYIALPITVVAVEIARDVLVDRRLERHEAGVVTRTLKALDARFGEILVLAADRLGHIDIFNFRRQMKRLEHSLIMSRKLSALPVPTLKMPFIAVASRSQRSTETASST